MRITRIEIEGYRLSVCGGGRSVSIEREGGETTIRITAWIANGKNGKRTHWTMEVPARSDADELITAAKRMQRHCDGHRGTNSEVHDYLRELHRFAD